MDVLVGLFWCNGMPNRDVGPSVLKASTHKVVSASV